MSIIGITVSPSLALFNFANIRAAGWTALHHAALMSPPTLVSFLLTHGCSPFAETRKGLTPLDIVTAHSTMPGRQDVALLLGEAMRGEGWTGGRMEEQRRQLERRAERMRRRERVRENLGRVLPIAPQWWGDDEWQTIVSESDENGSEGEETLLVSDAPYGFVGWPADGQKDPFITVLEHARILSAFTPGDIPIVNN